MDYPDWYDSASDSWIELVSYFDFKHPPARGYQNGEFYLIELADATQFLAREPQLGDHLLRWLADVNRRYSKRTGRSVLGLVPLGAGLEPAA